MKGIQRAALLLSTLTLSLAAHAKTQKPSQMQLLGDVPYAAMVGAMNVGRLAPSHMMNLTVVLNLRHQQALKTLIHRLYNPNDSMYHHYLTPKEFRAEFGPTPETFALVGSYLQSHNLQIVRTTTNTIQCRGYSANVEKAFGVQMQEYQKQDGTLAYAPDAAPHVESTLASKVTAILGLNSFAHFVAFNIKRKTNQSLSSNPTNPPSGPIGGLGPADIENAYSLQAAGATGAGQTLGLMELDGFASSDIATYAQNYNINEPPLKTVLVDGYDGSAGQGADEVTLDIELMMAVAPQAKAIMVYEGPNSENGPVDVYAKIADDDKAKQISSSWGAPESQNTTAFLQAENKIFMQMAAQGQTIYAASGDSGAYDDGSTLSVDDPASQPYVVAAGGTTLTTASSGAYQSETSWSVAGSLSSGQPEGGGGGISSIWSIPSWQKGVASTVNEGSTTMRMVPDVAIDADPNTGYAIYTGGMWNIFGGTSCAAPIWAAFTALVNQARATKGLKPLGFANPTFYSLGESSSYESLFHDIADQSTNLYYPAVTGYDLSTGWGSMIGPKLFTALTSK